MFFDATFAATIELEFEFKVKRAPGVVARQGEEAILVIPTEITQRAVVIEIEILRLVLAINGGVNAGVAGFGEDAIESKRRYHVESEFVADLMRFGFEIDLKIVDQQFTKDPGVTRPIDREVEPEEDIVIAAAIPLFPVVRHKGIEVTPVKGAVIAAVEGDLGEAKLEDVMLAKGEPVRGNVANQGRVVVADVIEAANEIIETDGAMFIAKPDAVQLGSVIG